MKDDSGYVKPKSGTIPTKPGGGPVTITGTGAAGTTGNGGAGGAGGAGAAAATATAAADKKKAADRYLKQAGSLQGQINALKSSITTGFKAALNQRLANIKLSETQGIAALKEGYAARTKSLDEAESNNTKAAGDSSNESLANRNRERAQMLSEAMLQGAGESDALRAQQVSLRNWEANQSEVTRGFFDTLSSINASLTDLTVDTKTGFGNVVAQAAGDKDSVWTTYYNQQSDALTQLGNLYGQQSEYYGLANEASTNKTATTKQDAAIAASDTAYANASKENAKVWKDPGTPKWLREWRGQAPYEADIKARTFDQANQKITRTKAPEGATLRRWDE